MAKNRKSAGLAVSIVRVTLIVGAVTVLTAGAVAVFGASRLAAQQVAAGDRASLQVVQDLIVGHLAGIESVMSRVSADAATTPKVSDLDARLGPLYDASSDRVDRIVIVSRGGTLITALPATSEASGVPVSPILREAQTGVTGFRRVQEKNGTWSLWLTRAISLADGRAAIVLLRLDTSFLDQAVNSVVVGGERTILLYENGRALANGGAKAQLKLPTTVWKPLSKSTGQVSAPSADGQMLVGYYADVQGFEGVNWRLVVAEPSTQVMGDTAAAVAPTIVVLFLGGIMGVVASLLVAQRMVKPLRALELAAYSAANGSYVEPIPSVGNDEIGQVAEAFNAVALRLNALHDLAQLLASASQLDQVLDGILEAMGHIAGPGVAAVYLLDEDEALLVPVRARGVELGDVRPVAAAGEGWLAQSLRKTETMVHSGDRAMVAMQLPGLSDSERVVLTAPLISGHEALGVVVAVRDTHRPISEAEIEMVRTFSAQAAVAVHNSRLFEAETESLRIAEALRSVAERLVRPDGIGAAIKDVEMVVAGLFGGVSASFVIMDRAALGLPPAQDRVLERSLVSLSTAALGPDGVRPVLVRSGEYEDADAEMRRLSASALLIAPVAIESGHGAMLIVGLVHDRLHDSDLDLADAVANEVSLALDNAFLYERAVARAANLETVFRISQAVGSSLQVNVVLNRVLDVVQKILSADAVALMTYDTRKRSITTAMARGAIPPDFVSFEIQPGEDVPGYVFSTGEPAAFRDLHETMGGIAGNAAEHGLHSLLGVPLLARGRSIGVLMVFSVESGAFSDEDMSVLQTFASQAALALDTARLYSHEHDVASILQQSILPDALPQFAEIEAASVYQPAGADAEIGGDYYDVFRAPDNAIWFAIADVCGKGVIAATKTSMIKYTVRALAAAGYAPGKLMAEVNRVVSDTGEASDIVTLWVGRYDTETQMMTWSNGGHPPGMISHASGLIERTNPTGPLLGAVTEFEYGEQSVKLEANDLLLLYTDGVTEARSGKDFFGEDRVQDTVAAGGSADEIVRRLLTLVRRWVHGELRDDVAILAIAVRPTEGDHDTARKGEPES